ncbi:UvrD-helicase domain-containing protein [Vibrio sp. 1-Bac 57]
MKKLTEDPKKLVNEKSVQLKINKSIDENSSFFFDAGAGSGKTYALIESLKYILKKYGQEISNRNQNILCITYTNAAAENIKLNFGNSNIVKVSTIHERIWELIHLHQDALLREHVIKIKDKLVSLNASFMGSCHEQWLESGALKDFYNYFMQKEVKNLYYNSQDLKGDFEEKLRAIGYKFQRNKGKFINSINFLYGIDKLNRCLSDIKSGKNNTVKYDANFNSDRLHYMIISHDTLLEYGLALSLKYPMFNQIIIDSYPYILIDEYQDTNPNVVELLSKLTTDNKSNRKPLIGYFGDVMQSIYSDGISNRLNQYHGNLKYIYKEYNRRSRDEIINIFNTFRADNLLQESIYENNIGGTFSFHQLIDDKPFDSSKLVYEFVNKELSFQGENVDCLVLKNEMLAELSGFRTLYTSFKDFFFFKEQAQKLISKDLNKLDNTIRFIWGVMEFRNMILNKSRPLEDLLPKKEMPILMSEAQCYVSELQKLIDKDAKTFSDFITGIFQLYDEGTLLYKTKIKELFPFDGFKYSVASFCSLLNDQLPSSGSITEEERLPKIDHILNINLSDYIKWYEFINDTSTDRIKFHTYHSTKGLEYENVVIIMENSFANQKEYFSDFFRNPKSEEFIERRNLLYVACSRAISNLRVLYLDPIESFRSGVESFFGKPKSFKVDSLCTHEAPQPND